MTKLPQKIYISQPMRGKCMNDIMAERKKLVAEAAVELRTDDILVLDTLFINHDRPRLAMLGRSVEQMAEADAVIFAAGWRDARGCRCERIIAAEYGLRILDAQPKG